MIWSVPAALAGERLDRVLALLGDISRSRAATLIADGGVEVNGSIEFERSRRLETDDAVEADVPPAEAPVVPVPDPDVAYRVVHEDEHMVIVDKPAGVVVHPGAGRESGTLCHGLLARFPEMATVGDPNRPGIVHRLDRGTSGLLAVARTQAAYEGMVEMLARHDVDREYQTMVWGDVESAEGIVDAPIGRSRRDPTRMTVTPRGRPARTRYRVISHLADPARTLLTCWLETGRTHQIRVHLSSIGHPVVADSAYRGGPLAGHDLERPWLHARALRFRHPITGVVLDEVSPLPADLVATLTG